MSTGLVHAQVAQDPWKDVSYNIDNMLLNFVRRYTTVFSQDLEGLLNVLSVLWQILFKMPCAWIRSASPPEVLSSKG